MKRVLILTKNVLGEVQLQQNVQYLGYETFCSKELLESEKQAQLINLLTSFGIVFFCENISNEEVFQISRRIKVRRPFLIRFGTKETKENRYKNTEEKELLNAWLSANSPIDELREILFTAEKNSIIQPLVARELREEQPLKISSRAFYRTLSTKEAYFVDVLRKANGKTVKRAEIAKKIWNEPIREKHMIQLSQIAKKVRHKTRLLGVYEEVLLTIWGQGYRLTEEFCEQLNVIQDVS